METGGDAAMAVPSPPDLVAHIVDLAIPGVAKFVCKDLRALRRDSPIRLKDLASVA